MSPFLFILIIELCSGEVREQRKARRRVVGGGGGGELSDIRVEDRIEKTGERTPKQSQTPDVCLGSSNRKSSQLHSGQCLAECRQD